jgi:hypothetical protein
LADLGLTKAQIEAKYGKGIDASEGVYCSASVKDANGKLLKRPEPFSLTYRDANREIKVGVHFNSKGIATDVAYRTGGTSETMSRKFTNDDLRYFMQINGFSTNQRVLSEYAYFREGSALYPLDFNGNFISVSWDAEGGLRAGGADGMLVPNTGETYTRPVMIEFRTAESLTDQFVIAPKQWDEFKKAVGSHSEMQKEVVRKIKNWMDNGTSK